MGLVSEILGLPRPDGAAAPPPPRGIAEVETALSRLDGERRDAREALDRAKSARSELLLIDGSDKKIADLDADSDRHRLTLERCEKLEPLVRAELQSLQTEARRQRWREISQRYDGEARAFAAVFREALKKWQSLIAIRGEAISGFSQTDAGALAVPPHILTEMLLHLFEAELDRQRDFAARKPEPRRQPTPPPNKPPPPAALAPKGGFTHRWKPPEGSVAPSAGRLLDAEPQKPEHMFRKRNRELSRLGEAPLPEGQVGVLLLKSGIEIDGKTRWRGDEIAVPELQARRLVENNAAAYIDPAPKSAPAAGESDAA